jgi:hypothetical protein
MTEILSHFIISAEVIMFKVGDIVVSTCPVRKGSTKYGTTLTVIGVDKFAEDDIYYFTTNGGCFHSDENALEYHEVFNSPLNEALK